MGIVTLTWRCCVSRSACVSKLSLLLLMVFVSSCLHYHMHEGMAP
jgi:hypothetical protein